MNSFRGLNGKQTHIWIIVGVLLGMTLILQACFSMDSQEDFHARATWTPVAYSTDQPYHVEADIPSYFGEIPAVAIFGSQNPEDDTPLQAINLSTDDVYDVSSLTPGPTSTWSRPIMSDEKELFFQIGKKLYKLLPGGAVTSVDLTFDEEDPVFCNWSWKGQVVCLNDLMTEGYVVDRDLNVIEMALPAYRPTDHSVTFYSPYRVGENVMRIVQTKSGWSGVNYRELDLETLTITNEFSRFDFQYGRRFVPSESGSYFESEIHDQVDGPLDILGLTDDADQVFTRTLMVQWDEEGEISSQVSWVDMYIKGADWPTHNRYLSDNVAIPEKDFYHNQMITTYWDTQEDRRAPFFPGVYDLETGDLLFNTEELLGQIDVDNEILPYDGRWLVGWFDGLAIVNGKGYPLNIYTFPEDIIVAYGDDLSYVVTQLMEP